MHCQEKLFTVCTLCNPRRVYFKDCRKLFALGGDGHAQFKQTESETLSSLL